MTAVGGTSLSKDSSSRGWTESAWDGASGWQVYGGTSASSPIIASVYALAGTPGSSDVPNSYPYADTGDLNDVPGHHN